MLVKTAYLNTYEHVTQVAEMCVFSSNYIIPEYVRMCMYVYVYVCVCVYVYVCVCVCV